MVGSLLNILLIFMFFTNIFFLEPFKICFQPTAYLGKYKIYYSIIYFLIYFYYTLDIFIQVVGSSAKLDPFTMIKNQYNKQISGKPDCFLNDTEPIENSENDQKVDHYLTVTLLPHQIIIFPTTILTNMDTDLFSNMKYYKDGDLR